MLALDSKNRVTSSGDTSDNARRLRFASNQCKAYYALTILVSDNPQTDA